MRITFKGCPHSLLKDCYLHINICVIIIAISHWIYHWKDVNMNCYTDIDRKSG